MKKAPSISTCSVDLKNAISNLLDGINSSVLIDLDDECLAKSSSNQIKCGDLTIYINARKVTIKDKEIFLTPKEFDILYFLIKNKGDVFTKEQIYRAVWESDYLLDDSNIMAFIRKLRKKIEPDPDNPIYIITIWGVGYKFNDKI